MSAFLYLKVNFAWFSRFPFFRKDQLAKALKLIADPLTHTHVHCLVCFIQVSSSVSLKKKALSLFDKTNVSQRFQSEQVAEELWNDRESFSPASTSLIHLKDFVIWTFQPRCHPRANPNEPIKTQPTKYKTSITGRVIVLVKELPHTAKRNYFLKKFFPPLLQVWLCRVAGFFFKYFFFFNFFF